MDPHTGETVGAFGAEGTAAGEFGGVRAAVRVRGRRLLVVENDNNRLQLVPSRPPAAAAAGPSKRRGGGGGVAVPLQLVKVGGAREPESLRGPGGCAVVSGGWCGAPHELLAVADSHNNRLLLLGDRDREAGQPAAAMSSPRMKNAHP